MKQYTDSDLETALQVVASVIQRFGNAYWPVFDRLEKELEFRRSRNSRLTSYLARDEAPGTSLGQLDSKKTIN
jgi:hypothetical protein